MKTAPKHQVPACLGVKVLELPVETEPVSLAAGSVAVPSAFAVEVQTALAPLGPQT